MRIGGKAGGQGYRLVHLERVGSTNDEASALARSGDPGRIWVVADMQGEGRGRRGRSWESPPGNLYASLLLVRPCEPRFAPQLGFVAGVALHDAVAAGSGLDPQRLRLKWPNDLLHDGAKLAGILVEGTTVVREGGMPDFAAVTGIGVNVASRPAGTPYPAAALEGIGCRCSTGDLFAALSDSMAEWLATWGQGAGFSAIRAAWLARAGGLGEPIVVRRTEGDRRGIFRDLDADGRLLLEEQGRTVTIEAGDVFPAALAAGPI